MISIFIDFEFNKTQEQFVNPVCVAVWSQSPDMRRSWWLEDEEQRSDFVGWVNSLDHTTVQFVSYSVEAEAGTFLALGLDPFIFNWIDLYVEWRQLLNHCHKHMYGNCYNRGKFITTKPPPVNEYGKSEADSHEDEEEKETGQHSISGDSLASCTYKLLGKVIDTEHKDEIRDRIIAGGPFTEEEKQYILDYCDSDLNFLPDILAAIKTEQMRLGRIKDEKIFYRNAHIKGRWSCDIALIRSNGIPLNLERLYQISKNHKPIMNALIQNLNKEHYPFYLWSAKDQRYVESYQKFLLWVVKNNLEESWPTSKKSGKFKTDRDTLNDNEHLPEILAYRRVKESLGQIRNVSPGLLPTFMGNVGSDGRQRPRFGQYGTQTSRNAAKARSFTFALSAWMRSIIQAPPGQAITGADFANQEFLIAALESGDRDMVAAYDTGDPYLAFAKLINMVPSTATKKTHPDERNLAKALILGLQYGLGIKKLAVKLTRDTGKIVTEDMAKELRNAHKSAYPRYWEWQEEQIGNQFKGVDGEYQLQRFLVSRDGWYLYGDNPSLLSVANFPIQSAGAVVLRKAVEFCHSRGLKVIAPLHDAIYIEHSIPDTDTHEQLLVDSMNDAFKFYYGRGIRIDAETHEHGEEWIEEKGAKTYWMLAPYFDEELKFLME